MYMYCCVCMYVCINDIYIYIRLRIQLYCIILYADDYGLYVLYYII